MTAAPLTPEMRTIIVRKLGAALAARWHARELTNNDHKNERPERLDHAAGRDDHAEEGRDHYELYTATLR